MNKRERFWHWLNKVDAPGGWSRLQALTFLLVMSPYLYLIAAVNGWFD